MKFARPLLASFLAIAPIFTAGAAGATNWNNLTGGSWSTAGNWTAGVPSATVDAIFALNPPPQAYIVTLAGNSAAQNLYIRTDRPAFNLGGFTLSLSGLYLGDAAGQNGSLTLGGGVVSTTRTEVGSAANSIGSLTLNGTGMTLSSPTVYAGNAGFGGIDLAGGAALTATNVLLGASTGGNGSITIGSSTGAVSTLVASGYLAIGGSSTTAGGTGSFTVNSGGSVSIAGATKLWSNGTLNLNGGTFSTKSLDASVGSFGFSAGTIIINGGQFVPRLGTVSQLFGGGGSTTYTTSLDLSGTGAAGPTFELLGSGSLDLANSGNNLFIGNSGNRGSVIVDAAGSAAAPALLSEDLGALFIGASRNAAGTTPGSGTLTIRNGGVSNSYSYITVGSSGGAGTVNVDGAGSKLVSTHASLEVGEDIFTITASTVYPATGVLNLTNGAIADGGGNAVNRGTFIGIDGGTGTATVSGAGSALRASAGTLSVGVGGDAIGNNGSFYYPGNGNLAISAGGAGSGSVSVNVGDSGGAGTVSVSGTNSTLTATAGPLYVGNNGYEVGTTFHPGYGTLLISSGGAGSGSTSVAVGNYGGAGTASVSGTNSTLTATAGPLYVGEYGYYDYPNNKFFPSAGTLNISAAGLASGASASGVYVGDFGGNGAVTVDGAGSALTAPAGQILVGNGEYSLSGSTYILSTGKISLTRGGQASSSGAVYVGLSGGLGTISVDGTNSALTSTGSDGMYVGSYGNYTSNSFTPSAGTLSITNGGAVNSYGDFHVGENGGSGTVSVDGSASRLSVPTGGLFVGDSSIEQPTKTLNPGIGTLQITGGAQANSYYYAIVGLYGARGNLIVSGTNSQLSSTVGSLYLGYFDQGITSPDGTHNILVPSSGSLQISGGGQVTYPQAFIGEIGGVGSASVSGAASKFTASTGSLVIGDQGDSQTGSFLASAGTLNISSGATVTSHSAVVGNQGGIGAVTLDGAGSTFSSPDGFLDVGFSNFNFNLNGFVSVESAGTFKITNGAAASFPMSTVGFGGGDGTVSVDGANSRFTATSGYIAVGSGGDISTGTFIASAGSLSVSNGAQVSGNDIYIGLDGGNGSTTVTGGTLSAAASLRVGNGSGAAPSDLPCVGALTVTAAGHVISHGAVVGALGAVGNVSLSGANTSWSNVGSLNVGNDGSGNASGDGYGIITLASGASLANTGTLNVFSNGSILFNGGTLSAGALNLAGGHITLSSGHDKVLQATGITLTSGKITLADNALIVDYTGSAGTLDNAVRTALSSSIIVSGLTDSAHRLGYADTAVIGAGTFNGVAVDNTAVIVKYTFIGDCNLDGKVDIGDLGILATHWQKAGAWQNGDFDFSGKVDIGDLGLLATNWQAGVNGSHAMTFQQALAEVGLTNDAVPEPAALTLIGLLPLLARRRAK